MPQYRDYRLESREFRVTESDAGARLDKFLSRMTGLSRARIQKALADGACAVDALTCADASRAIKHDQIVSLSLRDEHASPAPEEGDIGLLYSDSRLVVLDKPPRLTVHPCPSCPEGTLVNRLLSRFPQIALQTGLRPGIVHRLDKDTSGLMVAALDDDARLALSRAFAGREVDKTYLALCRGLPPSPGESRLALGRHPTQKTKMAALPESRGGRAAFSQWVSLYDDPRGRFSLLAVTIHSGRTHQVRVHLAESGHPLWGDKVYGPRDENDPAPRQMLHAWKLAFAHPGDGRRMAFTLPPPPDFLSSALALSRRFQRLILTGVPGCGKSRVLDICRSAGLPVWSADACAADLYKAGADGWRLLRARYGERFVPGERCPVDKAALTRALIDDPGLRPELEAMIHPLIHAAMAAFFQQAERSGGDLAVAEVPLWFEGRGTRGNEGCLVAAVTCPAPLRRSRLARSRNWSDEKTAAVESWQWPEQAKKKASDFCLDNDGDLTLLQSRTHDLLRTLASMREEELRRLAGRLRALWTSDAERAMPQTNYAGEIA